MKKRLFVYTSIIILAGLLCFFAVSIYTTHTNNIRFATDTVIETAQICAVLYSEDMDISKFDSIGNDIRITIVASDGTVLADSRRIDPTTTETHLNRPEIQAAAAGTPTPYTRRSDSLGIDFMYYAVKVNSGSSYVFVRVAMPIANIDSYLSQSLPLLIFVFCVVVIVCSVFYQIMIQRITKPFESVEVNLRLLSRGDYTPRHIIGSYDEIDQITQSIDDVAETLKNNINDLRDEKDKLDYIINNIGDGLFVVDENMNVVLINSAAINIFNAAPDVIGKNLNYLTYDGVITEAVGTCVRQEKNTMLENMQSGRIFFIAVNQLPNTKLTMVALSDVTEMRENAKHREEFFTNASHELKTPLTAIKGFNELTANNNNDESLRKYIDGIARETDRMLSLIGDMLKLSELENSQIVIPEPVSLAKVIGEVQEALSTAIVEKDIIIETVGDAVIPAEPGHLYELVKNIVENAIRYNNQGGRVSITVESNNNNTWLFVFDDGIGISPEEQTRIFERFYRVEKSRSQRSGGTGLGLSIIKHICVLYDWKLSLKSKLGVGTEVTVEFTMN